MRGHRAGLLRAADYNNLYQCETLEDVKLNLVRGKVEKGGERGRAHVVFLMFPARCRPTLPLHPQSATDYGPYLANDAGPPTPASIVASATSKLVDDWTALRASASSSLARFLDLCVVGHMIDNVVLVVSGTLHERDVQELLDKCHPLGLFDGLPALAVASSMRELYRLVLVDTPLAPYFAEELTAGESGLSVGGAAGDTRKKGEKKPSLFSPPQPPDDLDEMNVEVMRNTLYKAYLGDFAAECEKLGGATAEVMSDLLSFDADRRALNITLNSMGTDLTRDDRRRLYSALGELHPHGHLELAGADDFDAVRAAMERCPPYRAIFAKLGGGEAQALDRVLFEEEARRCGLAFERQFGYGVFFAYLRLREQEIRNLLWICECVAQDAKARAPDGVVQLY